ncbi:MAG: hypothetical protein V1704_03575 [Candidatus Vogelbacteria bacterium]
MWSTSFRFGVIAFLFVALISSPGLTVADSVASNKPLDIPVRLIKQEYLGNEATIITTDLGRPGIQHSSLTLTTSSNKFHREVQIEGSDDNQTWVKFETTRFIYDGIINTSPNRNTTITYPITTFRYLRITIYDRGEKRLIIAGALAHPPVALTATSTPQSVSSTTPLPPPAGGFFDRHPYFLIGLVILITVGVIGGCTFRLFKQTQV